MYVPLAPSWSSLESHSALRGRPCTKWVRFCVFRGHLEVERPWCDAMSMKVVGVSLSRCRSCVVTIFCTHVNYFSTTYEPASARRYAFAIISSIYCAITRFRFRIYFLHMAFLPQTGHVLCLFLNKKRTFIYSWFQRCFRWLWVEHLPVDLLRHLCERTIAVSPSRMGLTFRVK